MFKQKISPKIPRIGILPLKEMQENEVQEDDQTDYEVHENSQNPIIRVETKGKGKGKGKRSKVAPKSSIEL